MTWSKVVVNESWNNSVVVEFVMEFSEFVEFYIVELSEDEDSDHCDRSNIVTVEVSMN